MAMGVSVFSGVMLLEMPSRAVRKNIDLRTILLAGTCTVKQEYAYLTVSNKTYMQVCIYSIMRIYAHP